MIAIPAWLVFGPTYRNEFLDIATRLIIAEITSRS